MKKKVNHWTGCDIACSCYHGGSMDNCGGRCACHPYGCIKKIMNSRPLKKKTILGKPKIYSPEGIGWKRIRPNADDLCGDGRDGPLVIEDWGKEFDEWWNKHDDFMGGLSSNLVPDLKNFIMNLLSQAHQEEREKLYQKLLKTDGSGWSTIKRDLLNYLI